MQNRFVHIVFYFIVCCFSYVAIANNSYHQDPVSPEAKNFDRPSVVREQISRSQFVRITFLDDTYDTICHINKGIKHFELSEYVKNQTKELNHMSIEILKIFSKKDLVDFNKSKFSPIVCELTVLKDGKIVNISLIIPAKFSTEISDQKLLDIKEIVSHTQLDEIPYDTPAVRFNCGVPRELIVQLLKSKN